MKQNLSKWKGVIFLLLLTVLVIAGGNRQVSAASDKCRVVFANSRGKVSTQTYRNWAETVEKNEWIVLPELKASSGYRYYWVMTDGNKVRKYNPGANYRVSKNVKFCLRKYKEYTVSFMTANGRKEYISKRKSAIKGAYIKLPSVPHNASSQALGWATTVNGSNYKKAGTKVKVTGNMKFYPITKKVSGVNLRANNGKLWKVVSTDSGKNPVFPSVNLRSGNMCLGWSRSKGKTSKPEYLPGDKIPTRSGNYYMVIFGKGNDKAPSVIRQPEKHDKVYLVGDSRTVAYKEVLGSRKPSNVEIIAKGSQGIKWFEEEGYAQLRNKVVRSYKANKRIRQAVVINLGVNDLRYYSEYTRFMKKVADVLGKYNCDMYYMSINPTNSAMNKSFGVSVRTENKVKEFNEHIRSQLCSGAKAPYTYINTCAYLQKYGWISNRHNAGLYDGLHYSNETYLRIYDYCIKYLNR